ncbi:MAG TPA: amino acid adenylation domain-containing protein, partial [Granulicella sp.]|nr:amino acid adenylation domain-containing protein [Granulicella sp.]
SGTAKFDLTLALGEGAEGIAGFAECNRDLFDAVTIDRLLGHLGLLLESVAEDAERTLSSLHRLSVWERHQLLYEWNDTWQSYGAGVCLHELIGEHARRHPDRVAVELEGEELSYGVLVSRAARLAGHLRSLGVGPEVVVGIAMERSLEMVVGLLGILEAAGAYLPLDPSYPSERLEQMAAEAFSGSRAPVLLTQAHLASRFGDWSQRGWHVLRLDADWDSLVGDAAPVVRATPENLAYVIYTSGSTGRPKGAMNTHAGICNRLLWMQAAYGLEASDRVLQKTPYSFDVSVWEFFWPLLVGARLVLARPEGHKDNRYLRELIADRQITTMHFVPSMLQLFVEEGGPGHCASLRRVMASGEALPWELQRRFLADSGAELHNLYGPTEAAVDVTAHACSLEEPGWMVPIGRPIGNLEIYVVGWEGSLVPVGVAGEVHIGGMGLGRGYLGRPELTAERFVPHGWARRGGERLYRTGDLGRLRADGEIEFLSRIDHQIKIRGFRVELGEIEAVLARHPAVREAVVVAVLQGSDLKLCAYVVPQSESLSTPLLREYLRASLPEFMVP